MNKRPGSDCFVKLNCPEFTSLCPITGQPDCATIYISFVPGERTVICRRFLFFIDFPPFMKYNLLYKSYF